MTDSLTPSNQTKGPQDLNPGYAANQLAKALRTQAQHSDPTVREQAGKKVSRWERVLSNLLSGNIRYGSRAPVLSVPAWATLEVVTGGFATGELLAGGDLRPHEIELLKQRAIQQLGADRRLLNAYFLSEAGLAELRHRLKTGTYDISVPEEGALLMVAWLTENGETDHARSLVETIFPFFEQLRFYPIPRDQARPVSTQVYLQTVGKTQQDIHRISPNKHILTQKEATQIWLPLYDRIVSLFLETVEDGWPCQRYPQDWQGRAQALLKEYALLRKVYWRSPKLKKPGQHDTQLRQFLEKCTNNPQNLTGRDVGRIRHILTCYQAKRGTPNSPQCQQQRQQQRQEVSAPMFYDIAQVVAARLDAFPPDQGLQDVTAVQVPITSAEATPAIPSETPIPYSIQKKVRRARIDSAQALIEAGIITSGETLATVLPQITADIRAMGIADTSLRGLYAAIYKAFRQRRSLLLLNLEHQVQIEELPWIAAIEQFRSSTLSSQATARQTLEEITVLTLTAFPHVILPNKLLQELRALAKSANLEIPLVDELAADIFMGQFSKKYVEAATQAATLLNSSLYATYYDIDYSALSRMQAGTFAQLCTQRAGVTRSGWSPSINGCIIEQQQILTTQNLAPLYSQLDLSETLLPQLPSIARACFSWICQRQQKQVLGYHAQLIRVKNTAYAWRQMIFYLSLVSQAERTAFLDWAQTYFDAQSPAFTRRFNPAMQGLQLAAAGHSPNSSLAKVAGAKQLLGWTKSRHWLLTME